MYFVEAADAEAAMAFVPALLQPGDVLLFDSFLPHRSAPNTTASWRRSAYLTFNRAAEGEQVQGKYQGADGGKNWFAGVVTAVGVPPPARAEI